MKKPSKKRPPKKLLKKGQVKNAKQTSRRWGLATRLEHRRVTGNKMGK